MAGGKAAACLQEGNTVHAGCSIAQLLCKEASPWPGRLPLASSAAAAGAAHRLLSTCGALCKISARSR